MIKRLICWFFGHKIVRTPPDPQHPYMRYQCLACGQRWRDRWSIA